MEEDHLFRLNYAITLVNNDELARAADHFAEFERLFAKMDDEARSADPEVMEQRTALFETLRDAGHHVEQLQSSVPPSSKEQPSTVPVPPPQQPGVLASALADDDDD